MQRCWWLLLLPVLWLLLLSCCLTSVTANSEGRSALPYPHPLPSLPRLLSFSLLFPPSPHHELFDLRLLRQLYSRNPAPCGARILWRTPRDTVAALVATVLSRVSQSVNLTSGHWNFGFWEYLELEQLCHGSFFMAAARSEFTEQTGLVSLWWQMVCQHSKLERYEEWL
jgi:hypothetical protein